MGNGENIYKLFGLQKSAPVVNLNKDRSLPGKRRVKARRRERRESKES